jgi:regulation of enolase protein 1 (concanavalin A-like superfamily)
MRPRVHPFVSLPVLFLVLVLSTPLHAQENGIKHPLTLAELTYGEGIQAMVADGAGGFWFGGSTCSTTLPTTSNAIQKTWSGPPCVSTGLLGHMTADGSITYLSYLGGSGPTTAISALALGPGGNLYIAGSTTASDFPTSGGAYDRTCGGGAGCSTANRDGFVSELAADGSHLVFSTFLGGSGDDSISSIAVDSAGLVHVAGLTLSSDFPVTPGALQPTFAGGFVNGTPDSDAMYARLSADGSTLQYGTYLGGTGPDYATGVAIDASGNAYTVGTTSSTDFPTFDPVNTHGPAGNGMSSFLVKFAPTGPAYSTFTGTSGSSGATAVAVAGDRLYVAGALPEGPDFGGAAYISELVAATGGQTRTIHLHGAAGTGAEGFALAVDQNHVAYLAGYFHGASCESCGRETARYPITWDAQKRELSGAGVDAVLSIVDFRPQNPAVLYSTLLGGSMIDQAFAVALDGAGGAFVGGYTQGGIPPVRGQAPPPREPGAHDQSFVAHIGVQRVTMPAPPADIVLYAYDANGFNPSAVVGNWQINEDQTAAGGWSVHQPDSGAAKIPSAGNDPANYVEASFLAQAGVPYHLWLRMRADHDSYSNDSVWVQFSDSVDSSGNPTWRIDSANGTAVVLEDCSNCGEQGWGWNDNGYGTAGAPVTFATSGWHTIRIQQREDGVAIDQIVLSSDRWATVAPGANQRDTTILRPSYALPYPSGDLPPTVSVTSPADGSTFGRGSDITITAFASDSDGTIASVDFYASGTLLGRATTAPFSTNWPNAQPGTYSVYAVATDDQGAVANSPSIAVHVTGGTSQDLPGGWSVADIGHTGAPGSASYAGGTFTVQGGGADVWGTSDALNYVYTPLSGDASIVARVASVSDQANWVKAGVMIRSALDPSAAQAFMLVSHAKGVAFQRRTTEGVASLSTSGTYSTAPRWVRLVRRGATISGYESADGIHWTLVGSDSFNMPGTVYVGLAVSSHVDGTLATATFDSVETSVPPPWQDGDIGSVPIPGAAADRAGTFTVTGSGADIWGTADAFHYVYRPLDGDGTIVARVASVQNVAPWVKAGVMMRDTFDPGSAQAFVLVSAGKGIAFQRREATSATSVHTAGSMAQSPHWVKLTRNGDVFTAYESTDGTNWTEIAVDTIPMAPTIYVGLAVTSHTTAASATATFDHVTIE